VFRILRLSISTVLAESQFIGAADIWPVT